MAKNCMICGKKITIIKLFLKIFWIPFFKIDGFTSKYCRMSYGSIISGAI